MKLYYLIAGLAGLTAAFYLNFTYPAEPWWVAFLIGYACGTSIGTAISIYIRERWEKETGGFW